MVARCSRAVAGDAFSTKTAGDGAGGEEKPSVRQPRLPAGQSWRAWSDIRLLRLRRGPARHGIAVVVGALGVRGPIALTGKGGRRTDEQTGCCQHCGELLHGFTPSPSLRF
jgi:hypothetical protein